MRLPSGLNVALWTISRCVELGYLTAGCDIPQVHCAVPASSQKMHIVGTEDRKGRLDIRGAVQSSEFRRCPRAGRCHRAKP